MIWANPWAWLGLAALAVPILIHLLARETATPLPFPTLRFLKAANLVEVKRRRLSDIALLAVRCAILALAAAALAQPFSAGRTSAAVPRLVIVDASASVDAQAARAAAQTYGADAEVIERSNLDDALREAAGWARGRPSAVSVVVVSDFQQGALDATALTALPAHAGVALHRVGRRAIEPALSGTRAGVDGGRTTAAWVATAVDDDVIRVESAHEAGVARAMIAAARATAAAHTDRLRPATFVLRDAPGRQALVDGSEPSNAPWMFDVMNAISPGRAMTVKQIDGRAIVFLATSDAAAATDAIREAIPALAAGPSLSELEPVTLGDDELKALERAPSSGGDVRQPDAWAGRWFWIAALLLIGVETVLRRERRAASVEVANAA